jgi:hypothetical protein
MLLTQEGLLALKDFIFMSAPYDEHGKRAEGQDGLMLICKVCHQGGDDWRKHWPGHVECPSLRHVALLAQEHWHRAHQDSSVPQPAREQVRA